MVDLLEEGVNISPTFLGLVREAVVLPRGVVIIDGLLYVLHLLNLYMFAFGKLNQMVWTELFLKLSQLS